MDGFIAPNADSSDLSFELLQDSVRSFVFSTRETKMGKAVPPYFIEFRDNQMMYDTIAKVCRKNFTRLWVHDDKTHRSKRLVGAAPDILGKFMQVFPKVNLKASLVRAGRFADAAFCIGVQNVREAWPRFWP